MATVQAHLEADGRRWWMLGLLSVVEILGMSTWFSASAVSTQLQLLWRLDSQQVGWLTAAVQLGFVAGTALAAALNLADILPSRAYLASCALGSGLANAAIVFVPGFEQALGLRFLTGMLLAGVYPPAMKMIATWFRDGRGLAIGSIVGALTLGKATPYLVQAFENTDYRMVVYASSIAAVLAAVLVALGYRDGPHAFERRAFSWSLAGVVFRHRETRLAVLGYMGHMWELYAMWTWIPAFIAASLLQASATPAGLWTRELLSFGAIAAGALGCLWGGWRADRVGRERLVNEAMALSGACSLFIGLFFGVDPWLLALVVWAWGFFVVADSAQFSTLVTEVAPRHTVGTALTLQTSLGFLLTVVTIQLVPRLVEVVTWRWAFAVLALGPAAGIAASRRLARVRAARSSA